jgi:squalene-hopene/tetraprenyl-beta-curcumene cyclase
VPAAGGASPAGKTANGGLRSYGSMTYAGLKSMIFAGLKGDDPRAKAAVAWARQHYSLTENPGLGSAGRYYYYHLFAKALAARGQDTLIDAQN